MCLYVIMHLTFSCQSVSDKEEDNKPCKSFGNSNSNSCDINLSCSTYGLFPTSRKTDFVHFRQHEWKFLPTEAILLTFYSKINLTKVLYMATWSHTKRIQIVLYEADYNNSASFVWQFCSGYKLSHFFLNHIFWSKNLGHVHCVIMEENKDKWD